jgi:hypothetical protein
MAEKEKNTPPTPANDDDWEKDFFKTHGVTDENEQKAIRGRATVLAYDRARQKAEQKKEQAANPEKKPWYKD